MNSRTFKAAFVFLHPTQSTIDWDTLNTIISFIHTESVFTISNESIYLRCASPDVKLRVNAQCRNDTRILKYTYIFFFQTTNVPHIRFRVRLSIIMPCFDVIWYEMLPMTNTWPLQSNKTKRLSIHIIYDSNNVSKWSNQN